MMPLIDLAGRRFGNWLVLRRHGYRGTHVTWLCRCDCGRRCVVAGYHLRYGDTRRCSRCQTKAQVALMRSRSRPAGSGRTAAQIAQATGLKLDTVYHRLIRGWKPHELCLRPLRRGERRASP